MDRTRMLRAWHEVRNLQIGTILGWRKEVQDYEQENNFAESSGLF